jgi:BirA family biotin operon repressor/biotin-[acetyl-CoA-carboxylase] ligase
MLSRLAEALDVFADAGFAAFASEYARHDVLHDERVAVSNGSHVWEGVAKGVTSRGTLKVVREGAEVEIDSGEISVRRGEQARHSCEGRNPGP